MSTTVASFGGIPGLAERALRHLEYIRAARHEIYGAVEPLEGIENEAVRLIRLLTLVKDIDKLRTQGIAQQAFETMDLGARLSASMNLIGAENRRKPEPKVLRSGDPEYIHLQTMEGQMKEARDFLGHLILSVHVGLCGNPRDGFSVDRNVLTEVNEKVRQVAGANLLMYNRLKDRLDNDKDQLIKLTDEDLVCVGLPRVSGTRVQAWLDSLED